MKKVGVFGGLLFIVISFGGIIYMFLHLKKRYN